MLALLEEFPEGVQRETLLAIKPDALGRKSNVVDVHIKNLRLKLKASEVEIVPLRGVGYQLVQKK